MAVMLAEVYDAFKEAGTSDEKARKAAEAVTGYENRFDAIQHCLTRIEGDVGLLKWMVGAVGAMSLAILVKLFAN